MGIAIAICLNGFLAILIGGLAWVLWQWRQRLVRLNLYFQQTQLPQTQLRYQLVRARVTIAQGRLRWSYWQLRSRQLHQLLGISQQLYWLLRLRDSRRPRSKRKD